VLHQLGVEGTKQVRVSEEGAMRGRSVEAQFTYQCRLQPRPSPAVESGGGDILYEVRVPPVAVNKFEVAESVGWSYSQTTERGSKGKGTLTVFLESFSDIR
jgi:hypothetical protein